MLGGRGLSAKLYIEIGRRVWLIRSLLLALCLPFAIGALKTNVADIISVLRGFLMATIIQAGVSIFGLFTMDPALLAFAMAFTFFAVLNYIDKKRID